LDPSPNRSLITATLLYFTREETARRKMEKMERERRRERKKAKILRITVITNSL
jgi:hypothetical protein